MDKNLVYRASTVGNLTGDETLAAKPIGPMTNPLWCHINVPAVSSGDVLDVELEFLDDDDVEQGNSNFKQITAAGHYSMPFFTRQPQMQIKLNETDNGGPNFGAVEVWIATSAEYIS